MSGPLGTCEFPKCKEDAVGGTFRNGRLYGSCAGHMKSLAKTLLAGGAKK